MVLSRATPALGLYLPIFLRWLGAGEGLAPQPYPGTCCELGGPSPSLLPASLRPALGPVTSPSLCTAASEDIPTTSSPSWLLWPSAACKYAGELNRQAAVGSLHVHVHVRLRDARRIALIHRGAAGPRLALLWGYAAGRPAPSTAPFFRASALALKSLLDT